MILKYIHEIIKKLNVIKKLYDENQVIGVYGNSDDCKMFFDITKEILGDFKCKFIYIQTRTNNFDKNNNIYNIDELDKIYIDAIIIGSIFFENQIKNQIENHAKLLLEIYSLKDDIGYYKL